MCRGKPIVGDDDVPGMLAEWRNLGGDDGFALALRRGNGRCLGFCNGQSVFLCLRGPFDLSGHSRQDEVGPAGSDGEPLDQTRALSCVSMPICPLFCRAKFREMQQNASIKICPSWNATGPVARTGDKGAKA